MSMGSAVLNKPPSPFMTFVYCFLLISFLFYISHRMVVEREKSRASGVHGSPPRHDSNAVGPGSPKQSSPTQVHPTEAGHAVVNCGYGKSYKSCLTDPKRKSDESMYNWVEGVPPSYNSGGGLYPGRH